MNTDERLRATLESIRENTTMPVNAILGAFCVIIWLAIALSFLI